MMSWKLDNNQSFALISTINYTGDNGTPFFVTSGNFTLNGKPMINKKKYFLNHGDIIEDLDFNPPTSEQLR